MIKKFNEFIKESIWSDMQERGTGEIEKNEDNVNNKKSVTALATAVIDAFKSYGLQSDFKDDFDVVNPDNSSFYASCLDAFDIESEEGIYAGEIGIKKDRFIYDEYVCMPYMLYVCDTYLPINDYESVAAWIDFGYGCEDDYNAGDMEPAAFYYNPVKDEWLCNDLNDPNQVRGGKWIKRIMSIVAQVVNPDTKIK